MKTDMQFLKRLLSAKALSCTLIFILSFSAFPAQVMLASKGAQALINKSSKSLIKPVINSLYKKSVNIAELRLPKFSKLQGNLQKASGVQKGDALRASMTRNRFDVLQSNLSDFTGVPHKRKFYSWTSSAQDSSILNSGVYQRWGANNKGIMAALAALAGMGYVYAESQDENAVENTKNNCVIQSLGNDVAFSDFENRQINEILKNLGFTRENFGKDVVLFFSGDVNKINQESIDKRHEVSKAIKTHEVFAKFLVSSLDQEGLVSLVTTSAGSDLIINLVWKNKSAAALFCSRIDKEIFTRLCINHWGGQVVKSLLHAVPEYVKTAGSFVDEVSFMILGTALSGGPEVLWNLLTVQPKLGDAWVEFINESTFKTLVETRHGHGVEVLRALIMHNTFHVKKLEQFINKESFLHLCGTHKGGLFLGELLKADAGYAHILIGYIDRENFLKIFADYQGESLLHILYNAGADVPTYIRQFINKEVFSTLSLSKPGRGFLNVLLDLCPSFVANISKHLDKNSMIQLLSDWQGYQILSRIASADKPCIPTLISCEDDILNFATQPGGLKILSGLYRLAPEQFDFLSNSPTWKHLLNCPECPPLPKEYNAEHDLKNLIAQVVWMEDEYQSKYRTFVHGQRREYYLPSQLQTFLWSIVHNKPVSDFCFAHIKPEPSVDDLIKEKEIREKLLEIGRYDADSRQLLLFLNGPLFGNQTNTGSSSAQYIQSNDNVGNVSVSCQKVFNNFNLQEVYEKFKDDLDLLKTKFEQLSPYGNALFIVIPKNKVNDMVFVARPGGYKHRIKKCDGYSMAHVDEVLDVINDEPAQLMFQIDADYIEYCLIMDREKGGMNPESGIKIFPIVTGDAAKLAELEKEKEALFARIKDYILSFRRISVANQPE